ncbi:MAG TPA: universal stress protein [Bryobacteraceae bacterium]|jgi:nucleotide-binding universal stress UspA family protein
MPIIRRILFPVDFSSACDGAARYVEYFAGLFEAEITLFHAVARGESAGAEELLPGRKAQLEKYLAEELKYFTTRRVCAVGEPEKEITQIVQTWRPDFIMLPTHGLGYFRRLLLGSVAAKVLHDLDMPVWTSVHAESAPALEGIHCRRILCGLDLGPRSAAILRWAGKLAEETQACLGIIHAVAGIDAESYGSEFVEYLVSQETGRIEELRDETGIEAEIFIDPGEPAKVVTCAATNYQADLVVIGRHGGEGLYGHIFQHAYSIVRSSPCPVISI